MGQASERGVGGGGGGDGEWQSAVNLWAGRGVETEAVACGAVLARPGGSGAGEKPRAPCRSGAGGILVFFSAWVLYSSVAVGGDGSRRGCVGEWMTGGPRRWGSVVSDGGGRRAA